MLTESKRNQPQYNTELAANYRKQSLKNSKNFGNKFMKNLFTYLVLGIFLFSISCSGERQQKNLTDWVNPFIGTAPLTDLSGSGTAQCHGSAESDYGIWHRHGL